MRTRWRLLHAILSILVLLSGRSGFGQSEGPRVTPLGTQLPLPAVKGPEEDTPVVLDEIAVVLGKAVEAHGGRPALDSVRDSVSNGKVTFFAFEGEKSTGDVTLIRKGPVQVQRIVKQRGGELRQGSDGKTSWESFNGMTTAVRGGLAGNFIESQTVRSIRNALDSPAGSIVRDGGTKEETRIVEVEVPPEKDSGQPHKTRYSVDKGTSRITRLEWVTGEGKTPLGMVIPTTESYAFSDFRKVQGVWTPFRIDRYINGIKIEETRLSSVRYNTSVKDDVFKP